jgi:RimJ/RimL family protein N-acetyltransferase
MDDAKNVFLLLHYAFIDVGCQMVVTRTRASNSRNVKMMRGLGFSELCLKRLFGRHEDGIIFQLTDDDWKTGRFYMRPNYGQIQSTEAD